jgi:hypothetical protein
MSDQAVAANFLAYASNRMRDTHRTLTVCLDRLTEEQIWHRGADHENAIGNLLLHLDGNIRQWILHGIDGQPDVRQRDDEFTLAPAISSIEARDRLHRHRQARSRASAPRHRPPAQRPLAQRYHPGGHRQGLRPPGDAHRPGHPAHQADGRKRPRPNYAEEAVGIRAGRLDNPYSMCIHYTELRTR